MTSGRSGVLVVDDDPDYRLLVSVALERHPVLELKGEAADLEEGVACATRLRPRLVMVDTGLAGEPRYAFGRLRSAAPAAILVAVSLDLPGSAAATAPLAAPSVAPGDPPRWCHLSKAVPAGSIGDELVQLLEQSRGDDRALRVGRSFPGKVTSAAASRRFVEQILIENSASDLLDTATLLVSELVTNAVVYARTGCDLTLHLDPELLRVSVTDHDRSVVRRQRSGIDDASGRGIELVEMLATAWGTERDEKGKRIWFELGRTP